MGGECSMYVEWR